MDDAKKKMLMEKANNIRKSVLTAVHGAGAGHPGGSLGIADVLAYLYFEELLCFYIPFITMIFF